MGWVFLARGHPKITAKHRTTFMITKDKTVSSRGDCIIAVRADRSAAELDSDLKRLVRSGGPLLLTLRYGNLVEKVRAWGHPSLTLTDTHDMVVRKSRFICGRTLAIGANKAASDFSREFVSALSDPRTKLEMKIEAL